jgi:hypothetical protein
MRTECIQTEADSQWQRREEALGCHLVGSGDPTLVAMVQSADLRDSDDSPGAGGWIGRGSGLSFSSAKCVRLRW